MAEPIDLPFGLWTWMGRRNHKFSRIRSHHGSAHWRHLANTIEPSVCGGDAALCQITLTMVFSERELRYMLSPVRLSSVCRL